MERRSPEIVKDPHTPCAKPVDSRPRRQPGTRPRPFAALRRQLPHTARTGDIAQAKGVFGVLPSRVHIPTGLTTTMKSLLLFFKGNVDASHRQRSQMPLVMGTSCAQPPAPRVHNAEADAAPRRLWHATQCTVVRPPTTVVLNALPHATQGSPPRPYTA